ncbi:rhodanese-like domain-containing protein [Constantimarinum furrinae]|uniref:Sulfurtransferase n=1 Tax=Constantimarinum furrinae TaxID=2562285 RepID=A0A7G8PUA5_9FLAO|nr:rhodanese-like domain-containing protein [Constantimarinum furrinae]QNJ97921.1 sulfurtransferase [Constantimarinum furrinae]
MGILSVLFGDRSKKIEDFMKRDAVIVDVRSKAEYEKGAIPESKLIPLPEIESRISEIKDWNKPVILCCASGVRSGNAARILNNNGIEAMNGGGWQSLSKTINR